MSVWYRDSICIQIVLICAQTIWSGGKFANKSVLSIQLSISLSTHLLLSAYCVHSIVVSSKRDSDRVKSGGDGRSLGIWFHFALMLLLAPILEAGVSSPWTLFCHLFWSGFEDKDEKQVVYFILFYFCVVFFSSRWQNPEVVSQLRLFIKCPCWPGYHCWLTSVKLQTLWPVGQRIRSQCQRENQLLSLLMSFLSLVCTKKVEKSDVY